MKFDRKARILLLYVLLPIYLVMLGVFVYVSNVYRGKYALPKQQMDPGFVAFATKGYTLAQEIIGPGGAKIAPGTLVDKGLAESLVKTYGTQEKTVALEEPGVAFKPQAVPPGEVASYAGRGKFLVYGVTLGKGAQMVDFPAGTELVGSVVTDIEKAAAGLENAPSLTVVAATGLAVPTQIESAEFTGFLAGEYVLDEPVTIHIDGEEIQKQEGTVLNRDILLALMKMRDAKMGPDYVKVRGKGPVIGFQYTFVFIVLNFVILVVFLQGLLWKPVLNVLDKRRETVSEDLQQAKDHRRKAEALFEKYRATMESARKEREELIANGRREGEKERERITAEAKAEAASILERADLEVKAERNEIRRELVGSIGDFSVDLAARILGREVKPEDHRTLVNEFVGGIDSGEGEEEQHGDA